VAEGVPVIAICATPRRFTILPSKAIVLEKDLLPSAPAGIGGLSTEDCMR
jgi:hypothetical protein